MSAGSRYETLLKLASGGMATVWIGNARGALGFRQLVAIKKPHPHLLSDEGFRSELVAEARLASMIHHANVVDVRDVEIDGDSISLVMDYIEGASLGELLVSASRNGTRLAPRAAVRIVLDACAGLHAAHELVDERDRPVGLVHRDVSPQNILVGADGIARVADFGVAKFARKHMQSTSEGSLKGKLAYMAPEYVRGESIDRRFDVFALGIVLWESLAGRRCFRGDNEAETLRRLLEHVPEPVSAIAPALAPLDAVVACALSKDRDARFQNAAAMAAALEASALSAGLLGGHGEVAKAVRDLVGRAIDERRALVRAKQANEPSVASLMGVPPIVALPANPPAAATLVDVPATVTSPAAATPKMGGGMATETAMSAVPTTQPMTPPMAAVTAPVAPVPQTLASPAAVHATPAVANSTLRSDTSPVEAVEPHLAFHDPSRRAIEPIAIPGVSGGGSATKWIVSALVSVSVLAIVGGVAFVATRPPRAAPPNEPTTASSIAPVVATTPVASATASATTVTTTAAPATAATATAPRIHALATATATHAPPQAPSAAPEPVPSPVPSASTGRRPPPNPYQETH